MRFYADYHVHTDFSGDCNTSMEEMIKKAIKLGLKELAFTDHVDYDYPDPSFEAIDYNTYTKFFEELKSKYEKKINLLLGVEVGYQPHIKKNIEELLQTYPFDFVICSTHMADRLDFYTGDFFQAKNQNESYRRYFENVLDAVNQFQNYDVYGHLDFIVRYGNFKSKTLAYADFKDIIDEILRKIIANGSGIEINTSGYRYKLNQLHPQTEIVKRYKELGGEIITVGSDAHRAEDLCSHFDIAYALLEKLDIKYIATYRQRKCSFVKIF
ncbi:histidinol-phosphatase HisJ family protein [Thermosyntropha sp.]|uniref:histidinol-phosphatase HisJ family protein n=1 Tax=Thermosyntropha sp. TaxID=2740820 RepID=UPI0025F26D65|nr:histidinol-phosphatase HisJ family protein [Thermosyntropha sp.]MBO8159123.1 histidinol-phosphatase HisJ family protein [Thermosyntropha sp.]